MSSDLGAAPSSALSCGGIILAGGHSSRMGKSKSHLPFGNELMLQRVVRVVGDTVNPVVVVRGAGQDIPALDSQVIVVEDQVAEQGPLQGMATGLKALAGKCDAAFVSACDAPLLQTAFIRRMIALLDAHDIAVPYIDGFHHPLAGVYRVNVLAQTEALLETDRRRPAFLFDMCDARKVRRGDLVDVDPRLVSLRNCNNENDYRQALIDAKGSGALPGAATQGSSLFSTAHAHNTLSGVLPLKPGNIVAIIGAGGKHTLMYRLSQELVDAGQHVVLTSTTNLHRNSDYARLSTILASNDPKWQATLKALLNDHRRAVLANHKHDPDLYGGFGAQIATQIRSTAPDAVVLVKADGARKRLLKAAADHEPVYPDHVDICILVLSLNSIGKPLNNANAHRLERIQSLSGLEPGATISTRTLVDVIGTKGGYADRMPKGIRKVLYLSSCITPEDMANAKEIIEETGGLFNHQLCGDTIKGRFFTTADL